MTRRRSIPQLIALCAVLALAASSAQAQLLPDGPGWKYDEPVKPAETH